MPAIAIAIFAALLQAFNIPFSNIPAPWLAAIIILIVLTFSFVVYYALKRWSPETSIKADLSKFRSKSNGSLPKNIRRT